MRGNNEICCNCEEPIGTDEEMVFCDICEGQFHYNDCGRCVNWGCVCDNCDKHD